jgi:hypothetical protein
MEGLCDGREARQEFDGRLQFENLRLFSNVKVKVNERRNTRR